MVDLSRVRTSRAGQRKLIANYDAQYPARCFPWSCGVAYVLPNAFVRGLVTAIDCCIGLPIWQDATGYLDASFKYRLTANFELSIQGSNLLGTDTVLFQQVDNTGLLKPTSWFKNDRRIQFGIRYTM